MRTSSSFSVYWKSARPLFERIGIDRQIENHEELWRALGSLSVTQTRKQIGPMSNGEKAVILAGLTRLDRLTLAKSSDAAKFLDYMHSVFGTVYQRAVAAALSDAQPGVAP